MQCMPLQLQNRVYSGVGSNIKFVFTASLLDVQYKGTENNLAILLVVGLGKTLVGLSPS